MFKLLQLILFVFLTSFNEVKSQGGESCTLQNGGHGTCLNIRMCPKAQEQLKSGIRPTTCGFEGTIPLVCCDTSVPNVHKTKSEEFCTKYGKELYDLQVYHVAGGEGASIEEFPHMAALGFGTKDSIQWQCGGSLISERFVLTAAHCLRHSELGEVKYVRMGETTLDRPFQDINYLEMKDKLATVTTSISLQDFEVKERYRHPEYKPPATYNDIALIELNKPAIFSYSVKPACLYSKPSLPKANNYLTGEPETDKLADLTATGWGLTSYLGNPSVNLQKVILQPFNQSQCTKSYKTVPKRRLLTGILEDRQICAGSHEEKDTCQGDSGGPLQYYLINERLYGIVGTTSFGKACATPGVPSVYTRVYFYVPWIESIVWPALKEQHIFQSPRITE